MVNFKQFLENVSKLYNQLLSMRLQMVQAAQKIYDEWNQSDDLCDAGGICDEIASAISSVISQHIDNINIADGGQDGDDHAFVIAYNSKEAYGVDIPYHTYETGGGYCWKKMEGVKFTPDDVDIWDLGLNPREIRQLEY